MYNFAVINSLFLSHNASIQVKDIEELNEIINSNLKNPEQLQELGERAKKLIDKNSGSKEKIYQVLKEHKLFY